MPKVTHSAPRSTPLRSFPASQTVSTVFLGSASFPSPHHSSYPSQISPENPSSGDVCHGHPKDCTQQPEIGLINPSLLHPLLPRLRPLPPRLKTAPSRTPGLSSHVIHSDLGQGHTPPPPQCLAYFLGLIASVILSPASLCFRPFLLLPAVLHLSCRSDRDTVLSISAVQGFSPG